MEARVKSWYSRTEISPGIKSQKAYPIEHLRKVSELNQASTHMSENTQDKA